MMQRRKIKRIIEVEKRFGVWKDVIEVQEKP
jgi:hypothetical protein